MSSRSEIDAASSEAIVHSRHWWGSNELLAAHLPLSRIVKAFNAITMDDLETHGRPPPYSSERRALPVAGDDGDAKVTAIELYEAFGFDAVDVGSLAEGWRFERGTPAYCIPLKKAELERTLAATQRELQALRNRPSA